jgi:hypothetical protein
MKKKNFLTKLSKLPFRTDLFFHSYLFPKFRGMTDLGVIQMCTVTILTVKKAARLPS